MSLDEAINAHVPLVRVSCRERVLLAQMCSMHKLVPAPVYKGKLLLGRLRRSDGPYWWVPQEDAGINWADVYGRLASCSTTLVLVNPPDSPLYLSITYCGELEVTRDVVGQYLPPTIPAASASGLTLSELAAVRGLLAAARKHNPDLSPADIRHLPNKVRTPARGLAAIPTDMLFYRPGGWEAKWLAVDGRIFCMGHIPRELVPRGILLWGATGTGKTMSAKYLAREMSVPLYHFNLGAVLSMWLGESDRLLVEALSAVEQYAPCVMLLDEVDKLFTTTTKSGGSDETQSRLLSYLLWWLQEHDSRVLTVMTANTTQNLPPELYRPQRVDCIYQLSGLPISAAGSFAGSLINHLQVPAQVAEYARQAVRNRLNGEAKSRTCMSQAEVTKYVLGYAREGLVNLTPSPGKSTIPAPTDKSVSRQPREEKRSRKLTRK